MGLPVFKEGGTSSEPWVSAAGLKLRFGDVIGDEVPRFRVDVFVFCQRCGAWGSGKSWGMRQSPDQSLESLPGF